MRRIRKRWIIPTALMVTIVVLAFWTYRSFPINKVGIRSELIMLGDLNNDKKWDLQDQEKLNRLISNPFGRNRLELIKADVNKNQFIDEEDLAILNHLYQHGDPYAAEEAAARNQMNFVRPRELFRYIPASEYLQPPMVLILDPAEISSPFVFTNDTKKVLSGNFYTEQLLIEIRNEENRFRLGMQLKNDSLTDVDKEALQNMVEHCNELYHERNYFDLLLELITMVEMTETLDVGNQSGFIQQLPLFRSHLRALLTSAEFESTQNGSASHEIIFKKLEDHLKHDLGILLKIDSLQTPRDFTKLENYIERAEWQRNKSINRKEDFMQLLLYAQYDRRYLRAVSKTSRRDQDLELSNHNLPMLLLFREALRIKNGDKKAAIGLLDEALRIPFSWVKRIPPKMLPSSVALENFLLPGNKEDGSDKSRHWNVFGGVALYKSPEEALVLSLQREFMDVKEKNYTPESIREFIRDLLANVNGIYHITSMNPNLIYDYEESNVTTPK